MKLFHKRIARAALLVALALPCFHLRADLSQWARNVVGGTPVEAALFRLMPGPEGPVLGRRTPAESRAQLSSLIGKEAQTGSLYSLRALEDERQLDFAAAEGDWRRAIELASDKIAALNDLAVFYHRRLEPEKEVGALIDAAKLPASPQEALPIDLLQTRSARDFAQAVAVARQAKLSNTTVQQIYDAWLSRWPNLQSSIYLDYFHVLVSRGDKAAASNVLNRFETKFPDDWTELLQAQEELQDAPGAKLAIYSNQFSALWPETLRQRYFQLLGENHQLRTFVAEARSRHQADPNALDPVLKLVFYDEQSGKQQAADQILRDFVSTKEAARTAWKPDELKTVGQVFAQLHDYESESRAWYTLYSLPSAPAADRKDALVSLANVLLDASEQPIQFGSRDLSLYQNIATMDRTPGFLNGILSVALNTSGPAMEYNAASQNSIAYFHRAAAAQLAERLAREFPAATRDQEQLAAKIFSVYGLYGQDDALLAQLPGFLKQHKQAPGYADLALLLGDVLSRKLKQSDEFALYDALLNELAAKADRVPLGDQPPSPQPAPVETDETAVLAQVPVSQGVRSSDYSRVLDRYISRLVESKKLRDAIALFRREIASNPGDPGLYLRLAAFVEQNRFDADLEETYRAAIKQFPGPTWSEKLARFYLRRRRITDYQRLTKQLTDVFTGDEIETYLRVVSPSSSINPSLYLQINLYAHRRFPHNLAFIRNLLSAYGNAATPDTQAAEKLLHDNWFCDADLRSAYFGRLSQNGRLRQALATLPKPDAAAKTQNTVTLAFRAEGEAWLTHYESAAPAYAQLAHLVPGDLAANQRALSLHRSLSFSDAAAFREAANIGEKNLKYAPESFADWTTQGELYAEKEQFSKAAPYWDRLAKVHPGEPEGYLEAATVYWDYFQYDDALRWIGEGRRELQRPSLFAYEAGAVYENKLDLADAVNEYVRGALKPDAQAEQCQTRLVRLGRREPTRELVEQKTVAALTNDPDLRAYHLRLALIESQSRRDEEQRLLDREIAQKTTPESIVEIRRDAARLGFRTTEENAMRRIIAVAMDPIEKIRARMDLAASDEDRNNLNGAEGEWTALLNENPTTLGVIRANVDFYQRTHKPAKAASVLEAAAERAQPGYRKSFLREASEREVEAQHYDAARKLLDRLLADTPYDADLLAAKAETLSRQGDLQALAAFYTAELPAIQSAALTAAEKTERIAGLRRGYILALDRLGKFTEASDQYIEVINRYPEDSGLVAQAAHFAEAHQLGDRLLTYYEKATRDSPKDYRWPMVLARLDVLLGKYPEGIASYDKASYVRPDRTDFLIAKVDLETRLLRFEDALRTNQRLYDLTYHDPVYLEAQATLLARLGRKAEAVKMLRAALIDGRPGNDQNYVITARRLTTWSMYVEAQQIFEEGLAQTKSDPNQIPGYEEYLRVLTIERKHEQALQLVSEAVKKASERKQVFESGPWMTVIGETVDRYYTAEEKTALAKWLGVPGHVPSNVNSRQLLQASAFAELYAHYLNQQATRRPAQWPALDRYQRSRLRFLELGHQLEALPSSSTTAFSDNIPAAAVRAYVDAGSTADVIRFVRDKGAHGLDPLIYAWMIAANPAQYGARIPANSFGSSVVEALVLITDEQRSFAAIQARGVVNPNALWTPTATTLTGLYYLSSQPQVRQSAEQLLGPRTVQTELESLTSSAQDHLRGDIWFYQAARYGDYLAYKQQANADDYLPAAIEYQPAASQRYVETGNTLRDAKQAAKARQQYEYAAELSPQRADILDALAVLDWQGGDHPKAITEWKKAFSLLRDDAQTFPQTTRQLLVHVNRYGVLAEVKPEAEAALHLYIKHSGAYQFEPIIEGALTEAKNRDAAIQWMVALSHDENGAEILEVMARSPSLHNPERDVVYQELIQSAQKSASVANGEAARQAQAQVNSRRLAYVAYLERERHYDRALQVLESIQPEAQRPVAVQIRLESLNGHLDQSLKTWSADPGKRPDEETLLSVAQQLKELEHASESNSLLEFAYSSAIGGGSASVADYFGLAQLRFGQKRNEEAMKLLRTAVIERGAPFENLGQAAKLLEDSGMQEAAKQYYDDWRKVEPWNFEAQTAAARFDHDAKSIDTVRQSGTAPYATRIAAARAMKVMHSSAAGEQELDILTRPSISPGAAARPFFIAARSDAAAQTSDPAVKAKLYADAIATDPRLLVERKELARAAALAKQDHLATAAFNPAPTTGRVRRYVEMAVAQPSVRESAKELELQELAAGSQARLHHLDQAVALLESVLRNDLPAATRARVQATHDRLDRTLRLERLNAERSPILTESNNLQRIVKPRLIRLPPDESGSAMEGALDE